LLVRVDPLAVSRILGNLLDNGAAHSPRGTPIVLSAGRDGVHAVLAVQDDGPGIPPADRERIFERYERLGQPTSSPGGGGLGLGLYIAQRLARANHGELQATDPPVAVVPALSCACPWRHHRCRAPATQASSPRSHPASNRGAVTDTSARGR